MKTNAKPKVGRPAVSEKERERIIDKLAPYLSSGMSLGKAVERSGVPRSTVYKLYREDAQFMDDIKTLQKAFTVVVKDIIATELMRITAKQDKDEELTRDDKSFVQWIANTNKQMRKYYGNNKDKDEEEPDKLPAYTKDPRCVKTILQSYECYRRAMIKDGVINPDGNFTENADQLIDEITKKSQVQY